jgi:hypothetical protein
MIAEIQHAFEPLAIVNCPFRYQAIATTTSRTLRPATLVAARSRRRMSQRRNRAARPRTRTKATREDGFTRKFTWSPNRGGKTYHGTIRGAYEDLEQDGHCVLGMRSGSGGKKWYPLGPAVCPKGSSHPFVYHYKAARSVAVQVCRVTRQGKWINCSGPK